MTEPTPDHPEQAPNTGEHKRDAWLSSAMELILGHEGAVASGPTEGEDESASVACSDCFQNKGLRLDAQAGGLSDDASCPRCGSLTGRKLTKPRFETLAYRFFVSGTFERFEYGAAPIIQFNRRRETDIDIQNWLKRDIRLFEELLGIGFFYYGPRTWMIGEVYPLEQLQAPATRASAESSDRTIISCKLCKAESHGFRDGSCG